MSTTTTINNSIEWDRTTKDFAVTFDGEVVAYVRTWDEGDKLIKKLMADRLTKGIGAAAVVDPEAFMLNLTGEERFCGFCRVSILAEDDKDLCLECSLLAHDVENGTIAGWKSWVIDRMKRYLTTGDSRQEWANVVDGAEIKAAAVETEEVFEAGQEAIFLAPTGKGEVVEMPAKVVRVTRAGTVRLEVVRPDGRVMTKAIRKQAVSFLLKRAA